MPSRGRDGNIISCVLLILTRLHLSKDLFTLEDIVLLYD